MSAAVDLPGSMASAISLPIEGMTCASCVGRVERALKAVPGVVAATVNLATERATISGTADPAALVAAVTGAGYKARPLELSTSSNEDSAERKEEEQRRLRRDLLLATLLALPVFLLEMGSHLISAVHMLIARTIGMQTSWYIQFALTTLILVGPGLRFYRCGIPALTRYEPDMNSLVAVGTLAAYA